MIPHFVELAFARSWEMGSLKRHVSLASSGSNCCWIHRGPPTTTNAAKHAMEVAKRRDGIEGQANGADLDMVGSEKGNVEGKRIRRK